MSESNFDPGFTKSYTGAIRRTIEKDGSFNVRRRGTRMHDLHIYQFLVSVSWPSFIAILFGGYVLMNACFALAYLWVGIDAITAADSSTPVRAFVSAFFFSTHTFTTVGYGTLVGVWPNVVSSLEAMIGLMSLAIATGLLYGRFSRGSARLVFSDNILVAPHKGSTALMFRVANRRSTTLMELEARLLLMTVVMRGRTPVRKYDLLNLELPSVYFMPLTWTLVHPLNPSSPLHGKTREELAALQAEVLVLIKGYDDTFRQTVHARYSYRHDEFVWGRRFSPAFQIDDRGTMVVDLLRINALEGAVNS
jgi:inward rectifier potassium channel